MLELKITGDEEIAKTIAEASASMRKEAAFVSLVTALQPLIARMKANAPRDTGNLRESIGFRVRRYRGGRTLFGAVGARSGRYGKNAIPAKYVHLVEFGHWAGKGQNKKWINANGFMRRSWLEKQNKVLETFNREFGTRLELAVELRRRQTKHT